MPEVILKWMIVATPQGEYVNGDQEGELTRARFEALVRNFEKNPRQTPIYARGDHVEDLDERLADGWVEGLRVSKAGNLEAKANLHEPAAGFVMNDQIRLASICTIDAQDYAGNDIGEVLHHVLLTNEAFLKDFNIAASQMKDGTKAVHFFSNLQEVRKMSKKKLQEHPGETEEERKAREAREANLAEETEEERKAREAREANLAEEDDEEEEEGITAKLAKMEKALISVKADLLRAVEENDSLSAKLSNSRVDKDKQTAMVENEKLRQDIEAFKIRAIVEHGLRTATLKAAWCEGYAGNGVVDTTGTLTWLKASRFGDASNGNIKGAVKLLQFTAEKGEPLYKINRTFRSGSPVVDGELTLSQADRRSIRKRGIDPETVIAGAKAKNFTEFKELTAKEK